MKKKNIKQKIVINWEEGRGVVTITCTCTEISDNYKKKVKKNGGNGDVGKNVMK